MPSRSSPRCRWYGVPLLGIVALLAGGAVDARQQPIDKNSIELIVRGCLKGREVTADDVSGSDGVEIEMGTIFRLSAKGDLSDDLKRHNGQVVIVTGLVKKTALAKPGFRLGGGRIVIGGGGSAGHDPTRDPARNSTRRLIPMDVSAIDVISESCPTAKP
jgi:hypothetical protein